MSKSKKSESGLSSAERAAPKLQGTKESTDQEKEDKTLKNKIEEDSKRTIVNTGSNQLVKTRDGYMIANANDVYIGRSLIKYGEFSQFELDLFSQLVEDTDIIIEVGANYGSHTLRLCQLANQGRVFAIEPQRAIFQALCGNIAINSIFNCVCIQRACSDIDEHPIIVPEADFSKANNFGGISMIEDPSLSSSEKTVTLDTLFSNLDRLRLLKIDAEGMEKSILTGGKKLIKKTRPALFIENDRVDRSENLIKEIFAQGYRAFWYITPMYNPENFNGESENIFGNIHSFNMICFPKEVDLHMSGLQEIFDPSYHPLSEPTQ